MEKKEKEHIKICGISIWRILAYFVVYSVAGFIIETIFGSSINDITFTKIQEK